MNKEEAKVLWDEVDKAHIYIRCFWVEAKKGTKQKRELKKINMKGWDLYFAGKTEFEQEFYGNLSSYRDQVLALVAEATKIEQSV